MVIITACPYSATKHTAMLLTKLGLEVGHERMMKDGIVSWQHTHFSKADFNSEAVMLHQVRHPLMVISQIRAISRGAKHPRTNECLWQMFADKTKAMDIAWDIDKTRSVITHQSATNTALGAMNLWYWWNKFGTLTADGTYTIESLPDRWEWFLGMIGHEYVDMPPVKKTLNRHTTSKILSWDDLYEEDPELTARILELATYFGYDQIPYQYLDDPYYQFPEKIESSGACEADAFRHSARRRTA